MWSLSGFMLLLSFRLAVLLEIVSMCPTSINATWDGIRFGTIAQSIERFVESYLGRGPRMSGKA